MRVNLTDWRNHKWLAAVVAASLVLALGIGGGILAELGSNDESGAEPAPIPEEPVETSTTTTSTIVPTIEPGEEPYETDASPGPVPTTRYSTSGAYDHGANGYDGEGGWYEERLPPPPLPIPTTELSWEIVELEAGEDFWFHEIAELDGRYLAVGTGWDEAGEGSSVLRIWESQDGKDWSPVVTDLPGGVNIERVFLTNAGLVAYAMDWSDHGPGQAQIWTSADASAWTSTSLPEGQEYEWMWLNDGAGIGNDIVLVGEIQLGGDEPPGERFFFEKDDKVLQLEPESSCLVITDANTNELLLFGGHSMIWRDHDGGMTVYSPGPPERIVSIPWELHEQAYRDAFESWQPGDASLEITIEHSGVRLEIDDYRSTYVATDAATGAVLAQGRVDDLWQGPPPTFVDPDTGDVIMSLTWDEWRLAEQSMWGGGYYSSPIVYHSPDRGVTWHEVDIEFGASPGHHVTIHQVAAGPNGFVAGGSSWSEEPMGAAEPGYVELRGLWHSPDGITWAAVDTPATWPMYLNQLVGTGSGYLASGENAGQSSIWRSDDGTSWTEIFTEGAVGVTEGDLYVSWLDEAPSGVVAVGNYDYYPGAGAYSVTSGNLTLTITGDHHTLVDDATGEMLFEGPGWAGEGALAGVRYSPGGVAIYAENGELLFAATHHEMEMAMQSAYPEEPDGHVYYSGQVMLYRPAGSGWTQVQLPEELDLEDWLNQVLLTDGLVLASAQLENYTGIDWRPPTPAIVVGTFSS